MTAAISTTLKVKRGLRQIVMEVSGGVFGCNDPRACGVSEYTAFIVPKFAKATLYSAVLSGYASPSRNRPVTCRASASSASPALKRKSRSPLTGANPS